MNLGLITFWAFIFFVNGASKIKYKSLSEAIVYKAIIFLVFATWSLWIAGWSFI